MVGKKRATNSMSAVAIGQCFLHYDYTKQERRTNKSVVGIIDPKTGLKIDTIPKVTMKRKRDDFQLP